MGLGDDEYAHYELNFVILYVVMLQLINVKIWIRFLAMTPENLTLLQLKRIERRLSSFANWFQMYLGLFAGGR